jgi:hypothetical protein
MNKDSNFLFLLGCMRILLVFLLLLSLSGCLYPQINNQPNLPDNVDQINEKKEEGWNVEFRENFSEVGIGEEPDSLFILDGAYIVQQGEGDEKCLKLPGAPMGDFGLLFGPREKEKNLELSFCFFASKKGRRMPSVAASIGGIRGYRLRLNPAARNVVLSLDETVLRELPFSWDGDQWWQVRFQALVADSNQSTRLQFKLWPKQQKEPVEWVLSEIYDVDYVGGKCALWGFPYSSMPIFFDDLLIRSN